MRNPVLERLGDEISRNLASRFGRALRRLVRRSARSRGVATLARQLVKEEWRNSRPAHGRGWLDISHAELFPALVASSSKQAA